jgi:HrpA-like RNA helicase
MSATVDAERFSAYFHGCPIIKVPGRTFPVTANYLEDVIELTGEIQHKCERSIELTSCLGYRLEDGSRYAKYIDSNRIGKYEWSSG